MAEYSSDSDEAEAGKLHETVQNQLIVRYRLEVEKRLLELYSTDSWISATASEALRAGGKRLRPVVAVLTCEAICGNPGPAFPVAMAYELAHAASLVQDDVIDESSVRHGAPTVHERYGLARAIMLSDSMIFEIFSVLAKYQGADLPKDGLVRLLEYIGRAASLAAEGELLEVALSKRGEITTDEYLKVASQKTGALFAAAAASGAVAGRADKALVERMYDFGLSLGVAFQIGDDLLDMTGDSQTTGKPVFKDVQNNACNVLLVHALSKADAFQKSAINSLLFKRWFTSLEVERLIDILKELGSFDYANALLAAQMDRCRMILDSLPPSHARTALQDLTWGLDVRRA